MKWVLIVILAWSLMGCSGGGDGNTNPDSNANTSDTSGNITYDTSKTYYVITRGNLGQLAELATIRIADAGGQAPTALSFSHNGTSLAVGHVRGASVFNLADLNAAPRLFAHNAQANDFAWDLYGYGLAVAFDDGTVKLFDVNTGDTTLTFTSPNGGRFRHVAVSNDNRFIAVAQDSANVYIVSMQDGSLVRTFSLLGNPTIQDMDVTADSATLVVATPDSLHVFDISTGDPKRQIPIPQGVSAFDLLSSGKELFISNLTSGGLMLVDLTTGDQRLNRSVGNVYSQVALSADQQLLVGFWNAGGGQMAFYDTYDLTPVNVAIALPSGSIDKIAYGSDGTMIGTVGMRNGAPTLSIWRVSG